MQTTLKSFITTKKDFYHKKDLIQGTIHILLLKQISPEKIRLKFTRLQQITINNNEPISLVKYTYDFDIFEAKSKSDSCIKLAPGHHEFPFKFFLKESDPATCKMSFETNDGHVDLLNIYELQAHIFLNGMYLPIKLCEKELIILDEHNDSNYRISKRYKLELVSCFVFFKQYSVITLSLDKKIYYTGDKIVLNVQSTRKKDIHRVEGHLYQHVFASDGMECYTKNRLVDSQASKLKYNCDLTFDLPIDMQSTIIDDHFVVRYSLNVVIGMRRSQSVKFRMDCFVARRVPKTLDRSTEEYLPGIVATTKFLTLTNV